MSVPVELSELRAAVERFGPVAFLLTTAEDGRPHAVSFELRWVDDRLVGAGGNRTRRNASSRSLVSLLWPATEAGGYNLIVDGDAALDGDDIVVTPTWAVLHRSVGMPAPSVDGACGQDCVPLDGTAGSILTSP
ncbi:MAG: pyridoxamine 5'-phosphate oxidase family protein [Acidimicrobiia bacterium]|nr:pyridoxamine 5'-phosphate oxidase family protein [Acidimicrobiia bacterium]